MVQITPLRPLQSKQETRLNFGKRAPSKVGYGFPLSHDEGNKFTTNYRGFGELSHQEDICPYDPK